MEKKFKILDGDDDIFGEIGEGNVYLTAYPAYIGDRTHRDLEVGQHVLARYYLSGSSGTYRILRTA